MHDYIASKFRDTRDTPDLQRWPNYNSSQDLRQARTTARPVTQISFQIFSIRQITKHPLPSESLNGGAPFGFVCARNEWEVVTHAIQ